MMANLDEICSSKYHDENKSYICKTVKDTMMKRVITTAVLALMAIIAVAQTADGTLRFLGIPIDGRKTEMTAALKNKGFRYDPNSDFLIGEFNGRESNIAIAENRGKVYRIVVFDANTTDEGQIKIRYNNLLSQFENSNGKYYSLIPNEPIPEDEDISYELTVHKKQYSAEFSYNPIYNDVAAKEKIYNESVEECRKLVEDTKDEKTAGGKTVGEFYADEENFQELVNSVAGLKIIKMSNSSIWFTIFGHYGEYYIALYYDNLDNKANGEDL
jgi:hypothetical protein